MHSLKKFLIAPAIAAIACLALLACGLLFSAATAPPAAAMGTRLSAGGTQPVPASEMAAFRAEFAALTACVPINALTTSANYNDLLTAYNAAGNAASKDNYPQFQIERDNYRAIAAGYKTQFHCS